MTGSRRTGSTVVEIGHGVSLPNPPGFYAANGIGIQEKGNNPCLLTLWGRMVDPAFTSTDRKLASFELDKCRLFPLSTLVDFKQAQLPSSGTAFARGLLACGGHSAATHPPFILPQQAYSSTSWEIKGLKVHGAQVRSEPTRFVAEHARRIYARIASMTTPACMVRDGSSGMTVPPANC